MNQKGTAHFSRRRVGVLARFSRTASKFLGAPSAFVAALAIVMVWGASGLLFGFSSNWQLVINTGTTIVTFLLVFLMQNTQNRHNQAVHLKLDAIIDGFEPVREDMVGIEHASGEEIEAASKDFQERRDQVAQEAIELATQVEILAEDADAMAKEAREVAQDIVLQRGSDALV